MTKSLWFSGIQLLGLHVLSPFFFSFRDVLHLRSSPPSSFLNKRLLCASMAPQGCSLHWTLCVLSRTAWISAELALGQKKVPQKDPIDERKNEEKTFPFDPQPFTCLLSKRFGKDDLHGRYFGRASKHQLDKIASNTIITFVFFTVYSSCVSLQHYRSNFEVRSIGSVVGKTSGEAKKSDHLHSSEAL